MAWPHDAGAYYRDAVYLVGCGHSEIGGPSSTLEAEAERVVVELGVVESYSGGLLDDVVAILQATR